MARTIKVDYLARVEGEGALTVRFKGKEVRSVELRIFEPPRFFEAFLRGRSQLEVPDVTARICGICPVAYQMSSCHAIERALGVKVEGALRDLRRLLYCGEWIESHTLHAFFLHAPDFLGVDDAVALAKDHKPMVQAALRIKKAGNAIVEVLGGRAIHPVNVRVGGFYRAPTTGELAKLVPELEAARSLTRDAALWAKTFRYPELDRDVEYVALRHPDEYPMNEGRIASTRGLDIDPADFEKHVDEVHVEYSNALQAKLKERGAYLCGPLARYALNFDRLSGGAKALARELGIEPPVRNPFRSLLVRLVEVWYALDEALRIIAAYRPPARPFEEVPKRAGEGAWATEAPRGMLWHRYRLSADGLVEEARIVPPTSQNQRAIEEDLFAMGSQLVALPHERATRLAEHVVRNHDPCISCATHFLTLNRIEDSP